MVRKQLRAAEEAFGHGLACGSFSEAAKRVGGQILAVDAPQSLLCPHLRLCGEWFRSEPRLLDFIQGYCGPEAEFVHHRRSGKADREAGG
jgi:hypothetical protein